MVYSKNLIENSEFEKYLKQRLKQLKEEVLKEVDYEINKRDLIQFKGFIDIKSIFSIALNKFRDYLDNEKTIKQVDKFSKEYIFKGIEDLEKIIGINLLGVKFTTNSINDSKKYKILKENMLINVKTIEDRVLNKLRSQIFQGVINGESINKIKTRINETFGNEYTYAETMARTEANNLLSQGTFMAAKESGIKLKKYLSVHYDDRTSSICRELGMKYGNESQAIPLDQKFKWSVGKGGEKLRPPFHPNERTALLFVQDKK